jgi:uncharacterized protein (TIGR02466 family)
MPPADEIRGETCWPTTLFHRQWREHDAEAPALITFLRQLRADANAAIVSGVAERSKSPYGLFESRFDLFAQSHPGLAKLANFIGQTLAAVVSSLEQGRVAPEQLQLMIAESWFHISNDGGFHDAHHHHNCSWCGIYYLQVGDATFEPGRMPNGGSRFYSPLVLGGGYRDAGNRYLPEEIDIPVRDGLLVLFPSHLQHSGLPYRGREDRVVIAFNARVFLKNPAA